MSESPVGVTIRPLQSQADYAACVALQHETWGPGFGEAVPPAILNVAQRVGGVAAGAFDDAGALLGFVFGLTGVERGRVVHWSDMLAVRAGLRDAGIGRALKAWQREAARAAGASVMYWTYDPLVARNAYLNFMRLGVRAHEYVRTCTGRGTRRCTEGSARTGWWWRGRCLTRISRRRRRWPGGRRRWGGWLLARRCFRLGRYRGVGRSRSMRGS